jgi:Flp pilus assembly protein TadG
VTPAVRRARRRRPPADRGASVAEFVFVMLPLLVLFLGLVSLGLYLWARVLLTSAAADAARWAANANVQDDAAVSQRVRDAMSHSIAAASADGVVCAQDLQGDAAAGTLRVGVRCSMPAPFLMTGWNFMGTITVTGHALKEQAR